LGTVVVQSEKNSAPAEKQVIYSVTLAWKTFTGFFYFSAFKPLA